MLSGLDSSSSPESHWMVGRVESEAASLCEQWDKFDLEAIYHYTDVGTAQKILSGRALWAFDVLSMNDTKEFRHAVELVHEVLTSRWNALLVELVEYFHPIKRLALGQTWNAFVSCFCSLGDSLCQWRAYPPNASGVSIGFRVSEL